MNNRAALLFPAVLLWAAPGIHAQAPAERPSPPLVAAIPELFQWTITVSQQAAEPSGGARQPMGKNGLAIQKIVCTKTGKIKRDVVYYNTGASTEVWYYGSKVIVREAGGGFSIESPGSGTSVFLVPDLSREGFVGVDQLSLENLQSKRKLESGREGWFYQGAATPSAPAALAPPPQESDSPAALDAAPPKPAAIAWEAVIDTASRLPLVVKLGTRTLVYTYQPPPSVALSLPPEIQKDLSALESRVDLVNKLRALQQR